MRNYLEEFALLEIDGERFPNLKRMQESNPLSVLRMTEIERLEKVEVFEPKYKNDLNRYGFLEFPLREILKSREEPFWYDFSEDGSLFLYF